MLYDKEVRLYVFPEKYRNDIYDIANLFYKAVIYSGDNPPGNTGRPPRADASGFMAYPDCINVTESANGFSLEISFFDPDGQFISERSEVFISGGARDCDTTPNETPPLNTPPEIMSPAYYIKIALYRALKTRAAESRGAGRPLPWGALVGVRPVKTYMELAGRGVGRNEIIGWMSRMYDVSAEMSDLCLQVAAAQRNILNQYDNASDFMLYIGIPFCPSKCAYCSFPSDAHNKADIYAPPYIDALLKELYFTSGLMKSAGRRLRAVYIGGGTPTAINARELRRLICGVAAAFPDDCPDEYTVEAGRADTINREKLDIIRYAARSATRLRLCINPQSMNRATLDLIGRNHTPDDVEKAFLMAREAGFDDINMDIIAGLPGEGAAEFAKTLEAVGRLRPESLTFHTLCIKRSARFNERSDRFNYPDARTVETMQAAAFRFAAAFGMKPYYLYRQKNTIGNLANVGFAFNGHACAYNIHEMADCINVLAIGAGAVSKFSISETGRVERVFNVKNLLEYINRNDDMIDRKAGFFTAYDEFRA